MNEQNPHRTRDFVGGIILVLLLHIAFVIVLFVAGYLIAILKVPFFNRDYNILLLFLPIVFISISQVIYLLPTYYYFSRKGRSEVCKGIVVGSLITFMVNGTCSGSLSFGGMNVMSLGIAITAVAIGAIGIWWVTRSRT